MILDAIGRIGGALVTPRRTLVGVLERGDGSLFEVLALAALAATAVSPTGVGHAILLMRVSVLEGLMALSNAIFGRFSHAFTLALVGALLVFALGRLRIAFDRAIDAAAYALVPHFVLAGFGALMANLGVELWALPHRNLKGEGAYFLARLFVGYLGSVLLLGMLAWHAAKAAPKEPS